MQEQPKKFQRWTIKDVLAWTTEYFAKKRIKTPRLDAEVLLASSLGVDRLQLYLNLDRPLLPQERERYRELVRRRGAREPVALIVGKKEFWSIHFRVVPGVLIPRPETETLVEIVLEEIRGVASPWILEIGTGSGAVAVSILQEHSDARVLATDINPLALKTASLNAQNAQLSRSFDCAALDLFSAIRPGAGFDVICSNPPYIPSGTVPLLEPEITEYEPLSALDGGVDGLVVIRELAAQARNYLKPKGALILEVGDGQAASVEEILSYVGGFHDIHKFSDLSGKQRVVKGRA